jgi:hypothetical protein
MKLFPYEKCVLKTTLSASEIRARLEENVQPKKYFRLLFIKGWKEYELKEFEGEISGHGFRINRIHIFDRSFNPDIKGTFRDTSNGAEIELRIRPNILHIVWIGIWIGFTAFLGFGLLAAQLKAGESPVISLVGFGAMAFGYLISILGFNHESSVAKEFLSELLEEEEMTNIAENQSV